MAEPEDNSQTDTESNSDDSTSSPSNLTEGSSDVSPEISGRRPLGSRNWAVFQKLAAKLASTKVTPNQISVSSIVFGCLAGIAFAATSLGFSSTATSFLYLFAAVMIQARLVANLLDGMVAVEGGKRSPLGTLYNEVPDRISDAAIFIGAGYSLGCRPELGIIAAVVAVFVAYVRAIGSSAGAGEIFTGPMAKPQRMALMTAGAVACALASWFNWGTSGQTHAHIMGVFMGLIIVGGILTAIRRLQIIASKLTEGSHSAEAIPPDQPTVAESSDNS